jgi:hypothetical protein
MTEEDRRAIEADCERLIKLYVNLNDAQDWPAVAALYTEDARFARPSQPGVFVEALHGRRGGRRRAPRAGPKVAADRHFHRQAGAHERRLAFRRARRRARLPAMTEPKLLSGGNPQIPKGDGDAPVQAYIAAMPGWKSDLGRRLDAIIERAVPGVKKAVKWNSPFYGVEGQGWFLSYHCFTRYVKVTFFKGGSLKPLPPGKSKHDAVRVLDIREDDPLDEAQLADWIRQAAAIPGWLA